MQLRNLKCDDFYWDTVYIKLQSLRLSVCYVYRAATASGELAAR